MNINGALILEHKKYISAKRAAEIFNYDSDYIGQLCRAGKIECKMIGRSWFVTEESIRQHQASIQNIEIASSIVKPAETSPVELAVPTPIVAQETVSSSSRMNPIIRFVPRAFALPYSISDSYLFFVPPTEEENSSFPFFKISLGAAVFTVAFFFTFRSYIFPENSYVAVSSTSQASVISAVENLFDKAIKFFSSFSSYDSGVVVSDDPPPEYNGLAVTPSANSIEDDEVIKQRIRDSFSDQVVVSSDESGKAGVITPAFKKVKGDDFIYVLVPVNK